MNAVQAFWRFLYDLINYHGGDTCVALTQSTHSAVVYGGSCIQSFLLALTSHGQVAWEYVTTLANG